MRLEQQVEVAAPPSAVWAVVSDPLILGTLSDDVRIEEIEPGTVPGIGARYRAVITVGAVPIGGTIEIIEHTKDRDLAWTTLKGIDHRMRLKVRATPTGSLVTLRFGYNSPGILGPVADLAAFASLRGTLRDLLDRIVRQVERSVSGR